MNIYNLKKQPVILFLITIFILISSCEKDQYTSGGDGRILTNLPSSIDHHIYMSINEKGIIDGEIYVKISISNSSRFPINLVGIYLDSDNKSTERIGAWNYIDNSEQTDEIFIYQYKNPVFELVYTYNRKMFRRKYTYDETMSSLKRIAN